MTAIADLPEIRPSLLLDFANSGRVDPRIQCTRASAATCWGPDGKLRTVPANTPRIDYDPVTGKCLGLLVEEARTNLFPQSASAVTQMGTRSGTAKGVTSEAFPGNGDAVEFMDELSVSGGHYLERGFVQAINAPLSWSIFVKAVGRKDVWVSLYGNSYTDFIHGRFDLTSKSMSVVGSGSASGMSASIQEIGGGWFRLSTSGLLSASSATDLKLRVSIINASTTYVGEPGKGLLLYGAQLEVGQGATSYIPTEASAVTRVADIVTLQAPSYSDLSVLTDFTHGNKLANTRALSLYAASATASSIQVIGANSEGTAAAGVLSSPAGPNTTIAGLAAASGRTDRVAFSRAKDGAMLTSARGATLVSGVHTGVTAPMDTIALGSSTAAGPFNLCGHIRRVTLYPTALSQNQLNKLTAV